MSATARRPVELQQGAGVLIRLRDGGLVRLSPDVAHRLLNLLWEDAAMFGAISIAEQLRAHLERPWKSPSVIDATTLEASALKRAMARLHEHD